MSLSAIYTIHVPEEYRDMIQNVFLVMIILLPLHLLMANQKAIGIAGGLFHPAFSETLAKVLVVVAFYHLVVKRLIRIE
jgi:hypothetical protein